MFDAQIRPFIDPPLNFAGRLLARLGITANQVTMVGGGLGIAAAGAIVFQQMGLAFGLIVLSRLADGLDGAVARATQKSNFGGFLDIVTDFLFYGAIPMAFIWLDPAAHGAAGAWLLVSFYFNGATFLAYAILAEKQGLETQERGKKSLYFTGGLLEGAETIAFFLLIVSFPQWFVGLAWVFGGLCFTTAGARVLLARDVF